MPRHLLLAVLTGLQITLLTAAQAPPPALQWFKGNTHAHTLESDGDSTPDEVTRSRGR